MIRRLVWETVSALVVALVLALLIKTIVFSNLGFTLVAVEGSSMLPLFQSGDLVLVVHAEPSDIHVGDIIVYKGCGGRLIIHRVAYICETPGGTPCFVTWGDNNPAPDTVMMTCSTSFCERGGYILSCVPYNRVLGKVVEIGGYIYKIPFIGGLAGLAR